MTITFLSPLDHQKPKNIRNILNVYTFDSILKNNVFVPLTLISHRG